MCTAVVNLCNLFLGQDVIEANPAANTSNAANEADGGAWRKEA
jgi:hypothetical protein